MNPLRIMTFEPNENKPGNDYKEVGIVVINLDQISSWEPVDNNPYYLLLNMANGQSYFVMQTALESVIRGL